MTEKTLKKQEEKNCLMDEEDMVNGVEDSDDDMEADDSCPEPTEEELAALAEKKKIAGNGCYTKKDYDGALGLYSEAIQLCPRCAAYYGNRSAAYMMLHKFQNALEDARQAVQLDPKFINSHLREAKCHLYMGETGAAISSYQRVISIDPNNNVARSELEQARNMERFTEEADRSYKKGDYRKALYCIERCLNIASSCMKYKTMKAECLVLLKRFQEAQELANDLLRANSMNSDAIYVRGLCLYYQDNIEKAFQHFQQVLRLNPDHDKSKSAYKQAKCLLGKKEQGNEAFRCGRLQEAYDFYTEALGVDPLNVFVNAKLYCNRATVGAKLKKLEVAIADCNKALELDDTYLKAYMRRAKCYMDSEQYEEAVRDYEKIMKMDSTRENKRLLSDAKLELKKSKRKDYYKILGVSKEAAEDEIKKAYRKRALLHHPDRHSNASDGEKKDQEVKFKEVGEAYSVLSDRKKKMRYDSGQDLEEMECGGGFSEMDPNLIFQTFFGGGMGGGAQQHFSYGGPGDSSRFTFNFG